MLAACLACESSADNHEALLHLEQCEHCRVLMSCLIRGDDEARPAAQSSERVGRFVILDPIGEGAAGVVFSAYDPQLDRKVALKLLHPFAGESNASERARREAQALAKLQHPNVITVHDVGRLGDEVFIAMELVEGGTLRRWLAQAPRTQAEVLAMFLQAGRGLAAAHVAGIVHRDFKPDNVLVGRDGRARVTDFGLAVLDTPSGGTSGAVKELPGRVGTPNYMAPEQHRAETVDGRADQFSFCVALHEALTDVSDVRQPASEGAARSARLPATIQAVLRRGMRPDPVNRFPSMDALLTALSQGQRRRRLVGWAATAIACCVVGGGIAYVALSADDRPCAPQAGQLVGIWDHARAEQMRSAFLATGKPYAASAFIRVNGALDDFAQQWLAMGQASCEAERERRQSREVSSLREKCIARRRDELKTLTDVLVVADATVVQSEGGTQSLSKALAQCGDAVALLAEPKDPVQPAAEAVRPSSATCPGRP